MAAKKSADQWFAKYGESHQHPVNKCIHWICVPAIFFCVLGFVWIIPVPDSWQSWAPWFNWALMAIVVAMVFYVRLSFALAAGLLWFMVLCYAGLAGLSLLARWPIWQICGAMFVVAWIGQIVGHRIEGRKPAFLHDLVFLLIGPAWLMSVLYKKVGQRY